MFFRKGYRLFFLIVTLVLLLHACATQREKIAYDPPVWSPDSQQLAFAVRQNENWDIYKVNVDGTALTQLTTHLEVDRYPAWSPDGKRIVFSSHRDRSYSKNQDPKDCCGDVYVMEVDSLAITRLTQTAHFPSSPAWSPDGKHIVFVSDDEIYVMEADGNNQTKLVSNRDENGQRMINVSPRWSPDGNKITFTSSGIFLVNADGGSLTKLSDDFEDHSPSWSFNGEKLVYSKTEIAGAPKNLQFISQGIWIVDAQGLSQPKKLADGTGAAWSPNSQRIAFSCQPDGNKDDARQSSICLINSDGSNLIKLNYSGSFLTWSSDGRKIAFINQTQKRQNSIYVINADGSGLTQLTGQSK